MVMKFVQNANNHVIIVKIKNIALVVRMHHFIHLKDNV